MREDERGHANDNQVSSPVQAVLGPARTRRPGRAWAQKTIPAAGPRPAFRGAGPARRSDGVRLPTQLTLFCKTLSPFYQNLPGFDAVLFIILLPSLHCCELVLVDNPVVFKRRTCSRLRMPFRDYRAGPGLRRSALKKGPAGRAGFSCQPGRTGLVLRPAAQGLL